jgi:hypothetical protein
MKIITAILIFASSLSANAQSTGQDAAQIVFLRPRTGTAIMDSSRAIILRVQEQVSEPLLVGLAGGGTKITYRVNPGRHTFAVVGGNAEFMAANLLPNTTYYVLVQYQSGRFRSQYSFKPVTAQEQGTKQFTDSLAAAKSVENDPSSASWLAANMHSVKQRLQTYYGPWQQKPASEKVVLGEP